jgi:hypothetical protein
MIWCLLVAQMTSRPHSGLGGITYLEMSSKLKRVRVAEVEVDRFIGEMRRWREILSLEAEVCGESGCEKLDAREPEVVNTDGEKELLAEEGPSFWVEVVMRPSGTW